MKRHETALRAPPSAAINIFLVLTCSDCSSTETSSLFFFRGDAGEVQRPFFDIFYSHQVTHEREISVYLPGRRFATPTDRFTVINCFGTSYSMMTSSTKYTTSAMHHVFLEGAA